MFTITRSRDPWESVERKAVMQVSTSKYHYFRCPYCNGKNAKLCQITSTEIRWQCPECCMRWIEG